VHPRAKNIRAPPPTKTTALSERSRSRWHRRGFRVPKFEVKNRCKNAEEAKAEHLL